MKKILLIFLTVLTANAVTAQTVYTPNGTAINASLYSLYTTGTGIHVNGKKPFELEAISDLLTITLNPIEYEGSYPLDTYNCHGFAFYMQGSPSHDPAAWIDESTVYVNYNVPSYDYSYIPVDDQDNPVDAKIVRYNNHTAVIPSTPPYPGWVMSKWGSAGLYYHTVDGSPYGTGVEYYKQNPAFINPAGDSTRIEGKSVIDYNPYPNENINDLSFQLYGSNAGNITWDVSGIQRVSSSGNTVTVRRTDSGSGTATLTALSGNNVITKRVFQLSAAPPPPVISGSKTVCSSATFSVNINSWQSGYHWSTNSSLINISNPSSNSTTISRANSSSKGESWVSVKNDRGTTVAIYYFWVGLPTLSGSFPSSSGWVGEPTDWTVMPYHPDYNTTTIEAYKGSTYAYAISTGGGHFNIYFPEAGNYTIMAYATNNCGSSPPLYYYNFTVYNYSMSLNSRSNELEITIDDGELGRSLASSNFTVTISDSNKASRSQSSYSGSNFKVPVSSLPDGTYTVNISNGKTSKTTELVIKR